MNRYDIENDERGLTTLLIIIILSLIGVVGVLGYRNLNNNQTNQVTEQNTANQITSQTKNEDEAMVTQNLHIKFKEGIGVRLRDGRFVSLSSQDLSDLNEFMEKHPGYQIERLFTRSEAELTEEKLRIETQTGKPSPDKNLWYTVSLLSSQSVDSIVQNFKILSVVEDAYPKPTATPPPQ